MLGGVVVSRFLAPKLRTRMLRYKMQQLDAESATTGDADVVDGPAYVRLCLLLGVFTMFSLYSVLPGTTASLHCSINVIVTRQRVSITALCTTCKNIRS